MALILTEPFNNFTTNGWVDLGGSSIVAGRTGTAAQIAVDGGQIWAIPGGSQTAQWTFGFALKVSDLSAERQFVANRGTGIVIHQSFYVTAAGAIRAFNSAAGASYTSAAGLVTVNTWAYIEGQVLLADSGGSITVRVNGTNAINQTGIDTFNATGTPVFDQIRLSPSGGTGWNAQYDDLYLRNDLSFQGDPTNPNTFARNARTSARVAFQGATGETYTQALNRVARQSVRVAFQGATTSAVVGGVHARVLSQGGGGRAKIGGTQLRVLRTQGTVITGYQVNIWDGSAWVAKYVKIWDGVSWVDPKQPVMTWNGTAWV